MSDATYVTPPPSELMACLDGLERFLHERILPPLVHAALAHAQFEAIHPFLDSTSRRLLITLLLVERDVLPTPLLYLSAWLEATQKEYYAHLLAVTRDGTWEKWLSYFFRGIKLQSEDALDRIGRIKDLHTRWHEQLRPAHSTLPGQALDLFTAHLFWTVSALAGRLDVSFATAQRAIARLESAGIVSLAWPAKRIRMFWARAILEILDEPSPFISA